MIDVTGCSISKNTKAAIVRCCWTKIVFGKKTLKTHSTHPRSNITEESNTKEESNFYWNVHEKDSWNVRRWKWKFSTLTFSRDDFKDEKSFSFTFHHSQQIFILLLEEKMKCCEAQKAEHFQVTMTNKITSLNVIECQGLWKFLCLLFERDSFWCSSSKGGELKKCRQKCEGGHLQSNNRTHTRWNKEMNSIMRK